MFSRCVSPVLCFLALVSVSFFWVAYHQIAKPKSLILTECTGHAEGNIHFHATLEITQDGKKIEIPANVGVTDTCIHPVHTHDVTGLVHVDYPRPVRFTLGDFFDTLGLILNDHQVGIIKIIDGYHIEMIVDGKKQMSGYRDIELKDNEQIAIRITSPPKSIAK